MAGMRKGTSPGMQKRGGEIGHLDGSEDIGAARGRGNDPGKRENLTEVGWPLGGRAQCASILCQCCPH